MINKTTENIYDDRMDKECIALCDALNQYPHVETYESCCGHFKRHYNIFFNCDDFITLAKLYRCVNHNYSCGKWEIVVYCSDIHPTYGFWLRSIDIFNSEDEMNYAINDLIDNLNYYLHCSEKLEKYFQTNGKYE